VTNGDARHTDALYLAADVVGSATDPRLTIRLSEYLLGAVDGMPKVTLLHVHCVRCMVDLSTIFLAAASRHGFCRNEVLSVYTYYFSCTQQQCMFQISCGSFAQMDYVFPHRVCSYAPLLLICT